MGRLKRKKPILARGHKAKKEDSMVGVDEAPDSENKSGHKSSDGSDADREKAARISRKVPPRAVEPSGVLRQPAFWVKTRQFLKEVKIELKRVTWPNRKETITSTAVVVILVLIISFFLGIVDFGLSTLVGIILG
ncbi:MAG: preprotein translocase subunit SecE [Desulfobacteria bacterium]